MERGVGCIVRTHGETVVASLPAARVGSGVRIYRSAGVALTGCVAAVERSRVAIAPLGPPTGIAVGDRVEIDAGALGVPLGYSVLGRAIDASGEPLDGRERLPAWAMQVPQRSSPSPGQRLPVSSPFWTGVRSIDGLLTIGRGARVGIFGAPGAGKTTLLETIAASARGDAVVLALVGERGREAQRWFERCDRRTTIVCATSDRSAAERIRAADVALAQAQLLRARGLHVVLIVDSLARYCAALREQRVGLGETVGRGGYPPSIWAELARFVEGAGNAARGSITLLATILSDGSDEREPLSDAARSLLDGHIALSSALARSGHYPAIDVLGSASRTMNGVVDENHAVDAQTVRAALALLAATQDARDVGLAEMTPALAAAVSAEAALGTFLRQRNGVADDQTRRMLRSVAALLEPRT